MTKKKKILSISTVLLILILLVVHLLIIPFYMNTKLCNTILNDDGVAVKRLLRDYSFQLNSTWNTHFEYPIVIAGEMGNVDVLRTLLDNGADINISSNYNAIHKAAAVGHPAAVEFLISQGATNEVTKTQCSKLSPFLTAVRRKRLETVRVFLKNKKKLKIEKAELLEGVALANPKIRKLIEEQL